jgi:uncharacterized membrane protein HdeD (DUF308 family)
MSPLSEGFLIGVIFTASLTASLFFLRFWKSTRNVIFLAFSFAFLMESCNRLSLLFNSTPNESSPWYYLSRMVAFLIIIAAIIKTNLDKP